MQGDPFADSMEQFRQTFFDECRELMETVESLLDQVEDNSADLEVFNGIFRAVHSIKAGAGMFDFAQLVRFTHLLEAVLDLLRNEKLQPSEALVELLFQAIDKLTELVEAAENGEDLGHQATRDLEIAMSDWLNGGGCSAVVDSLAPAPDTPSDTPPDALESDSGTGAVSGSATPDAQPIDISALDDDDDGAFGFFEPMPADAVDAIAPADPGKVWRRILFRPHEVMLQKANEPILLIDELAGLGDIHVTAHQENLPPLAKIEPETAYLWWEISLHSEADEVAIREVFEFVDGDCDLTINVMSDEDIADAGLTPSRAPTAAPSATPENAQNGINTGSASPLGAPLDAMDDDADLPIYTEQAGVNDSGADDPAGILAAGAPLAAGGADGDAGKTKAAPCAPAGPTKKRESIRVDLDRIDRLVNMVGELVITQSMLSDELMSMTELKSSKLLTGVEELSVYTRELQENVMAIRMQPVKSVFSRMPRLVRDLSNKLGKKVALEMKGEATEVDKTVIEELADPLTHMIRNSLDHGLEGPEEREAAGKDPKGTITLSAEHRGGRIIIEIRDDGRGINRPKVLSLAREKGIVGDEELSDEEIDNLIFAPGFSTADKVTDVSGRGVGMDVVRRNIQALGGRINLHSVPGKGSCFSLALPLTLAVLDGMIVNIGDQKFVIPVNSIVESIRPSRDQLSNLPNGTGLVFIRGEYIPLIACASMLEISCATNDPTRGLVVIVETDTGGQVGLIVDALVGQQQVVIKSLESNYRALPGISAATILGNGQVCLIIDIDGLHEISKRESAHPDGLHRRVDFHPGQAVMRTMEAAE